MHPTEKSMELIKICSAEYMDKHHHYWSIYFRFLLGIAFVMSIYLFGERNISVYIQASRLVTTLIFALIILLLGCVCFFILCRERVLLSKMMERYIRLSESIGLELFPEPRVPAPQQTTSTSSRRRRRSAKITKLEEYVSELAPISTVMAYSILVVTAICLFLIFITFRAKLF